MEDKLFVWTSELSRRLFELRFENDWIFKSKKQPWREFHKLLLEYDFPKEMTVDHVRKKWSYNLDMYRIAKKENNTTWKYFDLFDKHFAQSKILDKYESWNDEWRLKLIVCIIEAKENKLDALSMWRVVEQAMRSQDLPIDCCIQDIQGLWHHIRMTFNRKHRQKLKKGTDPKWPLYDVMLNFNHKFDPVYLKRLETEPANVFASGFRDNRRYFKNKKNYNEVESEFHWSKDITESFIQLRLQYDWLFKQKKYAWNEMSKIMIEEYGFPKTLTPRELGRKWASTYGEYQKAKATNNTSWVYHNLFELYLGESNLSLNPLVGWDEEWVFNLISARSDLEALFTSMKDQTPGWREVEKRLRSIGLPLDHSLLDIQKIWIHLIKTYRWKQKFANKGLLEEHWPYFEALSSYMDLKGKFEIKKVEDGRVSKAHFEDVTQYDVTADDEVQDDVLDDGDVNNDDYEDDIKLTDLKKRMQLEVSVEPKYEYEGNMQCRCCASLQAYVDVFEGRDNEGVNVAVKLRMIAGIEVDRFDNLPTQICLNCHEELENAYKFRRKCQYIDKQYRDNTRDFKMEISSKLEMNDVNEAKDEHEIHDVDDAKDGCDDDIDVAFERSKVVYNGEIVDSNEIVGQMTFNVKRVNSKLKEQTQSKKIKTKVTKATKIKKQRKVKYHYWKICEVCGKHTRNLMNHLDTHTTDKAYSCDVCDKKFKFKSGLLIHKAVHDPTPKKTCEVCGKTFHILAQYRRHFVYHANERKYGCDTCGKRFNTLDILRVHNRTHTDERPFTCEECGKTFRTAGCVSRHKRIVHRHIRKNQ